MYICSSCNESHVICVTVLRRHYNHCLLKLLDGEKPELAVSFLLGVHVSEMGYGSNLVVPGQGENTL